MDWTKELLYDAGAIVLITVIAGISDGWAHAMLALAIILLLLAIFDSPFISSIYPTKKG